MKNFGLLLFVVLASTASCLDPAHFQSCTHENVCTQLRGLIHYDWEAFSPFEQYMFAGRSWIIRPEQEMKTTVTIAFKDFNIGHSIFVITKSGEQTRWREIRPEVGANFEIIATDINSLTLYIPRYERGRFQAFFYVGCTVLTTSSGEIGFPSMDQVVGLKSTCWVVKPVGVRDISRIYFTLRDVYIMEDAKIVIEELHTNTMVAEVNSTESYDIFGTDTTGVETILVDLKCDDKLGSCEEFGNLFSLSYYAVDGNDVACMETQKRCALDPWVLPQQVCSRTCQTLENIIEEEFVKEQEPVLKSGALTASVKHTEEIEEHGNRTSEEKEEVEEAEEIQEDKRIKPKKPKSKPIRCQLRSKFCKCLRTQNDAKQYCFSKRKCKEYKKCWKACHFVRITICYGLRSKQSINLL